MPTVTIYSQAGSGISKVLLKSVDDIRTRVAELLSGKSRQLLTKEISVRLVESIGSGMIAQIEIEISAQNYPERSVNADRICLDMRTYMKKIAPEIEDVRVWLQLVELGHSWTEDEISSLHDEI